MKLRIKGDSLRLRLTRSEVQALAEQGTVADAAHFAADSKLEYRVRRDPSVSVMTASFGAGVIEVCVPEEMALEWCGSSLVTLEYTRHLPAGEFRIVVEKDFTCLVPRAGEDESDHFAHPKASAAS